MTANAIDVSKNKTSLLKIPQARADEGHGEEGGMKISDQVIVIDPLMDKIIKRIEMGADLSLSHIALTSDSNYAMRLAGKRHYLQNQRQNLRSGG